MFILVLFIFYFREILESDREDDPIQELQQTVASILTKYNFSHNLKHKSVSRHNSRIRHRITDAPTVEQVYYHYYFKHYYLIYSYSFLLIVLFIFFF